MTDLYGMKLECDYWATGIGSYYSPALFGNQWRPDLTFEEAKTILEQVFRVLFYYDKKAGHKMQLAKISSAGTEYLDPYEVTGEWNFRHNSEKTNEFWRGLRVRY